MKIKKKEDGFSYIETIISLVIVTIGLMGALSALTWCFFYMQEAEKRTRAKQIANSVTESIFAVRDVSSPDVGEISIGGWNLIQNTALNNGGVFVNGWFPARVSPGSDGIYGTADDSCAVGSGCAGNDPLDGFSRRILISDIVENNVVRKRTISISIQYYVGSIQRTETISTVIANLPMN